MRPHLTGQLAILQEKLEGNEALVPRGLLTEESWFWAHASFVSRAFPLRKDGALLPVFDLLDHDPEAQLNPNSQLSLTIVDGVLPQENRERDDPNS